MSFFLWPFIWDVISYGVDQEVYERRRKVVGDYIVERLRIGSNYGQTFVPLFKLVQLSGFSPWEWGIRDEEFHQKFDNLCQNHEKILVSLKETVEAIVPSDYWKASDASIPFADWKREDKNTNYNDWQAGSYYKDRLQTNDYKSVFKPAPATNRAYQIYRLQTIQSPNADLKEVVETLLDVKSEIEKERNIWDSALLKKINEVLADGLNFDSPGASSSSTATKPGPHS